LRGLDEIVVFVGKGNLLPIAEDQGLSEFEAKRRIGLVLHEELDHAAYLESVKRKVGPGGDINARVISDLKQMVSEIQASADNPSQAEAVNRALYASMAVYDPRVPEFTEAVDVVASIGALDLSDQFQMTQEFMRQVIQLRRNREPRRDRQPDPGHLGQVGALAADNGLVAAAGAIVVGSAAEGIDLLVHVSGLFPELAG
jgi:hypothetical protein